MQNIKTLTKPKRKHGHGFHTSLPGNKFSIGRDPNLLVLDAAVLQVDAFP